MTIKTKTIIKGVGSETVMSFIIIPTEGGINDTVGARNTTISTGPFGFNV